MKKPSISFHTRRPLLCATAALALCSAPVLHAQKPALVAAATRTASFHRAVQVQPDAAGEPQSTPTPPTPPDPNSLRDELFTGTEKFAKNANSATEVNMDPDSLRMVGGAEASRAHRTLMSVVRTYSYDKPGMYDPAEVEVYRRKLETGDWHCSIHTRDLKSGESTDICNRHRADGLVENAIITVEPKSLTFIHNIQRPRGQGGQVDWNDTPGVSRIEGLPSGASFAAIGPGVRADLATSMAGLAANNAIMKAEMLASTAHLRAEMGQLRGQSFDADHLRDEMDHVRETLRDLPSLKDNQQLEHLRDQLKDMRDHSPR